MKEKLEVANYYSLNSAWKDMIEILYDAKFEDFLGEVEGCDSIQDVNVAALEKEVAYLRKLQLLHSAVTLVENGAIDYKNLKKCSQFIREDYKDRDDFFDFLEETSRYFPCDIELTEEYVDSILSTIYE